MAIDTGCKSCIKQGGLYNMNCMYCRVRFLHTQPSRDAVKGWLAHWRKQGRGADETKAEYIKQLEEIRQ